MISAASAFRFSRARGLVWVCDLIESSKRLNDNRKIDRLELFLPRLYELSQLVITASGGVFIKWTGDGFLAWYETPLYRQLQDKAELVISIVELFTSMVENTQLDVDYSADKFEIKHAVTYEPDALLMRIGKDRKNYTYDLLGREVVFAFRLSGVPSIFPRIVTEHEIAAAYNSRKYKGDVKFVRWKPTALQKKCTSKIKNLELHRYTY